MFPNKTFPWIFFTSTTLTKSSSITLPRKTICRRGRIMGRGRGERGEGEGKGWRGKRKQGRERDKEGERKRVRKEGRWKKGKKAGAKID